jgi:hypothetical protein
MDGFLNTEHEQNPRNPADAGQEHIHAFGTKERGNSLIHYNYFITRGLGPFFKIATVLLSKTASVV